jgi:hypothetical protein
MGSMQVLLQWIWPEVRHRHRYSRQISPDGQEFPQVPQLELSLCRFTQAPLHVAIPDGQLMVQAP